MSGCEQPCNMSKIIIIDLNSNLLFFISYDSRVWAPEWKKQNIYTYCRVDPRNPTYGLMFWVRKVRTQRILYLLMLSMRRTVLVALHSTGYSRFALFSCLIVDKLLLVSLLSRYKVPPMGTRVFHAHLAWVVRWGLLLWKTMVKLDCYGSFVGFADIEWLWRVLHPSPHRVHRHRPEVLL
jgi:hypothetical protein